MTRPTASDDSRCVLDSSVWIEYLADGPLSAACSLYLQRKSEVITPVQVLYEVYRWSLRHSGERAAMEIVGHLEWTRLVPVDVTTTIVAVQLAAEHDLAAADALIYAAARLEQAQLISLDRHFRGLPGVTLLRERRATIAGE